MQAFQRRADLLLQGEIEQIVDAYATPMWTRFRGEFFSIADRAEMWSVLVRQHLSQKARGIVAIKGRVERQETLLHGRVRLTIDWAETAGPDQPDMSRDFRITYVYRPIGETHVITGFALEETRPPARPLKVAMFPPPCEDW